MSICRRILWISLALASVLPAQDTRGRVQGDVKDPSGAWVAGATVTLSNDLSG